MGFGGRGSGKAERGSQRDGCSPESRRCCDWPRARLSDVLSPDPVSIVFRASEVGAPPSAGSRLRLRQGVQAADPSKTPGYVGQVGASNCLAASSGSETPGPSVAWLSRAATPPQQGTPAPAFPPNSSLEATESRAEIERITLVPGPFMTNSSQIYSRAGFFQSLKDAEETQSSLSTAEDNYGCVQGSNV